MLRYGSLALLVAALAVSICSQVPLAARAVKDGDSMPKLTITIGDKTFVATLLDNATARAFTALLPMSISMEELNGNEKFSRLPSNMPTQASIPPSIRAGELMLYGSNTLVLFYESFSTPYSYTKIGQVDDTAGLKGALGPGSVTVAFDVQGQKR